MRDAAADGTSLDELVGRVAGQDRAAFGALYRASAAKLFALSLRILQDRAAAEDALQDAFVEIWRQAPMFDPARGSAFAWMAVIVRHRAIDALRRNGRNPAAPNPVDLNELAPLAAPESIGSVELMALLRCLGQLQPEVQKLILMAYLEGRSREELAESFERPVNTIKTWLRRGLQALRACLEA
jgi:RNA polymerase sigma-70 factor, ECF subfamily